ncbi:heme exporter protein CcmD [Pseudocolwellia sp. HL-MZ19]|uniref:heme exporter protein CcmD n=1 Tax=unclassified Pseudocolwellia TaxID=2848178 RepID=UPI003CFB11AE
MQFDNINAFFDMGGYGFYVWLSYGVTALAIILLIILSKQKHKNTLLAINQRYTRELKRKEAAKQQQELKQNNSSYSEVVEKSNESTP